MADILGSSDAPAQRIIAVNAFDASSVASLARPSYDLVITNPPYVRYQARDPIGTKGTEARSGLIETIESHPSGPDKEIWKALAEGYSGLADLSVPAWLLAALLVRPGGYLALVAPATWRSRDYADVVRYLLLRCFSLECIVEDKQPGWFSNALVRTHLIVARRLQPEDVLQPLGSRAQLPSAQWVQLAPESASERSLAGAAFKGTYPEAQLAAWVYKGCITAKAGIGTRLYDLNDEWASVKTRITRHSWYRKLEQAADDPPLFAGGTLRAPPIPDLFRDLFPGRSFPGTLITLKEAGIEVGQGLRTGCNPFFYITACSEAAADSVLVQASALFDHRKFCVPGAALQPVLQRQSDVSCVAHGHTPEGRVLDLRGWVLPEDAEFRLKGRGGIWDTRGDTTSHNAARTCRLCTHGGHNSPGRIQDRETHTQALRCLDECPPPRQRSSHAAILVHAAGLRTAPSARRFRRPHQSRAPLGRVQPRSSYPYRCQFLHLLGSAK